MAESGDHLKNEDQSSADSGVADDELEKLKAEEEELAKRVKADVSEELSSHMAKLELELKLAFDERMSAIEQKCTSEVAHVIDTRQTDILRTNKVIRDVSRALGTNWRLVFEELMSSFSPDIQSAEMAKIEVERPILQPYKALMTWKDSCGAEFDIRRLVEALKNSGLESLVEMSLRILDSNEKDSLITFSGFGSSSNTGGAASSGGTLGSAAATRRTVAVESKSASLSPIGQVTAVGGCEAGASASPHPKMNAREALDDRHILLLSKRIGTDWEKLARQLSMPSDEIAEILTADGLNYQGAFKMLWAFREMSESNLAQAFEMLLAGLIQLGHQDVVDQLFG